MSGFKGTPGPWFITGSMTKYVEARIGGGLIQEVASCGPTEADNGYGEHQRANAQLISAAPELLEALQMCEQAMKSCLPDFNPYDQAAYDKARAAIAKALGEKQ